MNGSELCSAARAGIQEPQQAAENPTAGHTFRSSLPLIHCREGCIYNKAPPKESLNRFCIRCRHAQDHVTEGKKIEIQY